MIWIGAALVGAAAIFLVSPLGARLSPVYLQADPAVAERVELWRTALAELQARPLLGVGPDNFGVAWYSMRTARSEALIGPDSAETSVHSWIFYFLTSSGLLGLSAFLAALVLAGGAAVALARRGEAIAIAIVPIAAYLGQGLVDVNDVSIDWVVWFAMGLLAGAAAPAVVAERAQRRRQVVRRRTPAWVRWSLVAAALLGALAVEVPRIGANRSLLLGETRINAGAQRDAIAPDVEAVQLDPRRAEYWSSLGTALAGSNSSAAASAFLAAAERAPWNRLHWTNIAITQRAIGNTPGALAAARRAVTADPNSAQAHRLLASVLLETNSFEAAATEGETALRLFPGAAMYEEPILAYIKLERWDRAVTLAQRAVAQVNSVHYHLRLAQALAGAGRFAEAKTEVDLVLQATPNDPEARDLATFLASKL